MILIWFSNSLSAGGICAANKKLWVVDSVLDKITSYTPSAASVTSVPAKPAKPTLVVSSSKSITLSWVIPADGGSNILSQQVQYRDRPITQSGWNLSVSESVSASATSHLWDNLLLSGGISDGQGATSTTYYQARIQAKNTNGFGAWSDWSDQV